VSFIPVLCSIGQGFALLWDGTPLVWKRIKIPASVQRRRDAARLQEERQPNEFDLSVVNRIADALETANIQDKTEDKGHSFREKVTIGLLIATVILTAVASCEAHRLVNATNDAINKSDAAATVQHKDTLDALRIAEEANKTARENAQRLEVVTSKHAAAAESSVNANISMERGRLYVASATLVKTNESGDRNPKVSYKLVNLGRTGIVITHFLAECYVTVNSFPLNVSYRNRIGINAMNVVVAGAIFAAPSDCILDKPIGDEDFARLNNESEVILLKGFARFEDVFGGTYTKRFGLFVSKNETQFYPLEPKFSDYNIETKDN
jgi:hypothetical protein